MPKWKEEKFSCPMNNGRSKLDGIWCIHPPCSSHVRGMKCLSMPSKTLIIADASWQVSLLIPVVFQMIRNQQTSVKAIFISCLLEPFKKNIGPNFLYLLMEEEKKVIVRIMDYFAGMNIPYDFRVITASPLETALKEMKSPDYDLIILQGEFIAIWKEDQENGGLCSQEISKLNHPILVINKSMEGAFSYPDLDSKFLNHEFIEP